MRNIELKARCGDLEKAETAARGAGAIYIADFMQVDNYFTVPSGRLKLREIDGKSAELIWYQREDRAGLRDSNYFIAPVPDPAAIKTLLAAALGIRGQVKKRRRLLMFHNIRIHL